MTVHNIPNRLRYRVSKSWVATQPSNETTALDIQNSARLPIESLQLEYAYGVNSSCGLIGLDKGRLAYASAGVGIIYDPSKHEQFFYLGHDDDITCITVDASLTLCATGQMGKAPCVHVWQVDTRKCLYIIGKGMLERAICAIGFSHDASYIAAIGSDNHHLLTVWDISRGPKLKPTLVGTSACQNGKPPQISSLFFSPFDKDQFVTCGKKHIRFWSRGEDGRLKSKSGVFSSRTNALDVSAPKAMLCGVYLNDTVVVTGGSNGCVYMWNVEDRCCFSMIHGHRGPTNSIVLGDSAVVITCGDDDNLIFWRFQSTNPSLTKLQSLTLPDTTKPTAKKNPRDKSCSLSGNRGVVALALMKGKAVKKGATTPVIVVATGARQLFCLHDRSWNLLVGGHHKDLYGLETHSSEPGAFVTVGEDKVLKIW